MTVKEHTRRKATRAKLNKMGYGKLGGHMKHPDEAEDKKLIKKEIGKARIKLRDGGCAEGDEPKSRADRMSRGGHAKKRGGHTTVNVVVGGQHPKPVPVPVPVPKPVPVPVNAGPGAMPPGAGGPPPGAGPMPDPNAPPMGLKTGGRASKFKIDSQRDPARNSPPGQFAKGGRTKATVPMKDGAGGGLGRIAKAKAYGA